MAKKGNAKSRRRKATTDLGVRNARSVKGGKTGKGQQEFLIVKMQDIIVTGVAHSGNSEGA
jgi:hypothetical protein